MGDSEKARVLYEDALYEENLLLAIEEEELMASLEDERLEVDFLERDYIALEDKIEEALWEESHSAPYLSELIEHMLR